MATEAIRVGDKEVNVIKEISLLLDISKEEALRRIFQIAVKELL
jgi:hypothetical protein